jgi:hypothetical protein
MAAGNQPITLVHCPQNKPDNSNTYFDWSDAQLINWKENAIQLQNAHVSDNNNTMWFEYNSSLEHRNLLELRILITLNGLRTPQVRSFSLLCFRVYRL